MNRFRNGLIAIILATGLTGCVTLAGAVVGGAAGHAIGGDAASTVAGAVVGGVVGHKM